MTEAFNKAYLYSFLDFFFCNLIIQIFSAVYSKMSSLTEAETATAELKEAKLAEDTLEEEGDGQQKSSEDMQMDTSERAVKIEVSRGNSSK